MAKGFRTLVLLFFIWLLTGCTRSTAGNASNNANSNSGTGSDPTVNTLGTTTADLQLQVLNEDILYINSPDSDERGFIKYIFSIRNAGTTAFDGPLEFLDGNTQIDSDTIQDIGNWDDKLDPGEGCLCEGSYTLTQADLDAGKVINHFRLSVDGGAFVSDEVLTDIPLTWNRTLTLTTTANAGPYNQVGQEITFTYEIMNNGNVNLGPAKFIINDKLGGSPLNCPQFPIPLSPEDSTSCSATYAITQADLDQGSVVSVATASDDVSGSSAAAVVSNEVNTEIKLEQNKELILKTVADPLGYDRVGQTITFTYEIINNGNVTLGPAQFTVDESILATPLNCGPAASSLLPTESILCTATYTVTQADLDSGSLTSNATATDGTTTSDATMVMVTKSGGSQPNPSGLTSGSTIQHTVIPGDWLMQIARCYGAGYESVRRANPHIYNPSRIWSGQVVSVPNIGSVGTIYGPPCVVFHTAVAGDTWESIAQQYNARVDILKRVNPGGLFTGANIKVPINSAGGSSTQVSGTKRIKFPSGATSATETGRLTESGKVTYLVAGEMGQTSTVTLITPDGLGAIAIYDPNGNTLFNEAESAWAIWSGILPIDGDYRIELASAAGITDQNYSLTVELTTPIGTLERVTNIRSESGGSLPRKPVVYNGALYFGAYEEDGSDRGLWKYDGTSVSLVAGNLGGSFGVGPAYLTEYNGALYFEADGGDGAGLELWKYDGAAPPSLVYDIRKGSEGSYPAYLAVYNGALYFGADNGEGAGYELWTYDGTNPPSLVEDIWDGPESSDLIDLAVYNGELYFNADDGKGAGSELWKYDGTSPPSLVEDIWDGPESSDPLYLTVYNGALYFSADNGEGGGYELWKYDGTNNPSLAADIRSGPDSSGLSDFAVYDGALYFEGARGYGDEFAKSLWKYDSTGTTRVADISPEYLAAYNGALYFAADGGDGAGVELWRYTSPAP